MNGSDMTNLSLVCTLFTIDQDNVKPNPFYSV